MGTEPKTAPSGIEKKRLIGTEASLFKDENRSKIQEEGNNVVTWTMMWTTTWTSPQGTSIGRSSQRKVNERPRQQKPGNENQPQGQPMTQ